MYLLLLGIDPDTAEAAVEQMLADSSTNEKGFTHGHRRGYGRVMHESQEVYMIHCDNCSDWSCGERGKPGPACELYENASGYPGCNPMWVGRNEITRVEGELE